MAGVIFESEIDDGIAFCDVYELEFAEQIARNLIEKGYRKADEVRKETAQEILNYLVKSTVIRTAPDTIKMFFRVNYGVEVEE